ATFDSPILWAAAASARGRLQLARGDAAGACTTLHDAVERWLALDVPYEVATARTLLGQALRDCGDASGAADSFTAAAEQFNQIGAHLDARLSDGGGRPSLPAGLTNREVEVLRLVAAGKSNSEIAVELYLS